MATHDDVSRTLGNWLGYVKRTVLGRSLPEPARPPRRAGFADANSALAPAERHDGSNLSGFPERPPRLDRWSGRESGPGAGQAQPFETTGPHGHRERMRQKLVERGADGLADYELLEMLLFFAFKQGDTKPLAKGLINRFGSFASVLTASHTELAAIRGVGPHAIAAIKLVQASAVRLSRGEIIDRPILTERQRLVDYLQAVLSREKVEQFRVLYLDTRNRLIADEAQTRGTVNHTPVYPREVVKRALELHSTAIIVVHNHPSGDPRPSRDDLEMTKDIVTAAKSLDIIVHDHLIVGSRGIISFHDEGLL